eukprot:2759231-Rhodomonas_salina.1
MSLQAEDGDSMGDLLCGCRGKERRPHTASGRVQQSAFDPRRGVPTISANTGVSGDPHPANFQKIVGKRKVDQMNERSLTLL